MKTDFSGKANKNGFYMHFGGLGGPVLNQDPCFYLLRIGSETCFFTRTAQSGKNMILSFEQSASGRAPVEPRMSVLDTKKTKRNN